MVGAELEYDSSLTFDELAADIDVTEQAVRAAVPAARLIYIEPDLRRDPADVAPDDSHEPH